MSAYLYDVVSSRFPAPEKVFIENHDGVKTTYRDLAEGSARMASALVAMGVVPGDRVAVQEPAIDATAGAPQVAVQLGARG